jgi:putative endonuclease
MAWIEAIRSRVGRWLAPRPLGQRGESAAARFLQRKGYKIVARSLRDRLGELDLVAVDARTVVFVEVKTRTSHDAGAPADAIDANKQARMTRAALGYLKRHRLLANSARFDVVAVTWPDAKRRPTIEHIQNAFEATGEFQMYS